MVIAYEVRIITYDDLQFNIIGRKWHFFHFYWPSISTEVERLRRILFIGDPIKFFKLLKNLLLVDLTIDVTLCLRSPSMWEADWVLEKFVSGRIDSSNSGNFVLSGPIAVPYITWTDFGLPGTLKSDILKSKYLHIMVQKIWNYYLRSCRFQFIVRLRGLKRTTVASFLAAKGFSIRSSIL